MPGEISIDEAIATLIQVAAFIALIVVAYLIMFGQTKLIGRLFVGAAFWVAKVIGATLFAAVLIIINTVLLIACIVTRLRRPEEISDCFIHYVERVTDAVVGPYR